MNYAASAEQYNVTIGEADCEKLDLSTNMIVCVPPVTQPEINQEIGERDGAPDVTVSYHLCLDVATVLVQREYSLPNISNICMAS